MRLSCIILLILYIQLFTINPIDGKSKTKGTKSSSKTHEKSTSSKIASTVGKVATTLTKTKTSTKTGGGFGGLKLHKGVIPIGAAVAGGSLLLPFLMRKKFKRRKLIPAFIGRDRYYRDDYMLRCYECEGFGSDMCITNPASYAARVTCGRGQYCSIIRREIVMPSSIGETPTVDSNQSDQSLQSLEEDLEEIANVTKINEALAVPIESNETTTVSNQQNVSRNLQVFISRGCNSPETVLHKTSVSAEEGKFSAKLSSQFCVNDFCNTGDGHLKCYDCEGEGVNHPCMTSPAGIAKRVTCDTNQYCNILKLTTMAYFPSNDTTVTKITIIRGCREDEEYEEQDGISLQSLTCSTDYCNGVDGNHLTGVNSASKFHVTMAKNIIPIFVSTLLINSRSYICI